MIINADLSIIYLYARRYDDAEAQARKTLEIDSRSFVAHYYLGAALQLTSRLKEAIPEFQKAVELNNDPYSIAMLAQAYARNGQTDEARKLLAHLNEMAKSAEVPEYALALAYTSLGEKDRAIEALEHGLCGRQQKLLFSPPGRSIPRRSSRRSALRSAGAKDRGEKTVNSGNFFSELKRRNVYKVAVAYIVAGWALAQGLAQVLPVFSIPNWVIQLLVVLIILGLPVALGLAWAFELTPEGMKRTETADAMPEATRKKKYVWIYVVVIGAAIIDWIIFSRSLLGCPYATRSGRHFGEIDRGSAV